MKRRRVNEPVLLRALLGRDQGYRLPRAAILSQHATAKGALHYGAVTGIGNCGRLWIEHRDAPATIVGKDERAI